MRFLLALLCWGIAQAAEARWELRFFHDEDDSVYTLNDLKFPSAARGAACGFLSEKGRTKPAVLVTSDGGRNWSFVPTKEVGLSLFFLNDNLGWMVTPGGIWVTDEAGRNWTRVARLRDVLRVYFLDEKRGFAVGTHKSVWSTLDGGRAWTRVEIAEDTKTNPDHTAYTWVSFTNTRNGTIVGASVPPRVDRRRFPDWMDPSEAQRRRQWPALNLVVETRDGGATWKSKGTSMFGQITRIRMAGDRKGLILVEFRDAFEWPSEVYRVDLGTAKSDRVFRNKDRAVTDVILTEQAEGFLAAFEPPGTLRNLPIPAKLKILRSNDLTNWIEMNVDYRAEGRRAVFAAAANDLWVGTDAGMILKLVRD